MSVRDWMSIAGFLVVTGSIFYNIVKTTSIKTNDLFHLEIDVKCLLKGQEDMKDKIGKNTERIAKIEGTILN